jgi:hypothetical protein
MMRIDLPTPLKAGASMSFNIKWFYNINNYQKKKGAHEFSKKMEIKSM